MANCPKQSSASTYDPTLDFTAFPLQVALKTSTGYGTLATAPSCSTVPNADRPTGALRTAAAQTAGFCADVYAFTRDASSKLTRPILFVEDPRFTPISR